MFNKSIVWSVLSVLTLSACGFHPHGHMPGDSSIHRVVLRSADPFGPFARNARRELRLADLTVIDDSEDPAVPVITLMSVPISNDTLSIWSRGKNYAGHAAQREAGIDMSYQIRRGDDEGQVYHARASRKYFDSPGLGGVAAKTVYDDELYEEASRKIVRDLEHYVSRHKMTAE